MSSSPLEIVAIITPAPGKADRVKELLLALADKVKENEPGVLKYKFFEQFGHEGARVIVVEETYKDEAAFNAHSEAEHYHAAAKLLAEESLLSGPLDVKKIAPFGGFERSNAPSN